MKRRRATPRRHPDVVPARVDRLSAPSSDLEVEFGSRASRLRSRPHQDFCLLRHTVCRRWCFTVIFRVNPISRARRERRRLCQVRAPPPGTTVIARVETAIHDRVAGRSLLRPWVNRGWPTVGVLTLAHTSGPIFRTASFVDPNGDAHETCRGSLALLAAAVLTRR